MQCDWKMHLQHVQMHEFGMFLLQLEFGICYSGSEVHAAYAQWFKHVARQNKRDKDNTAQRLADSLRHFTCLFVCCEKKVRARSSENLWVFDLRVFASLFIGIAA